MHWIDPDCLPEVKGTVERFVLNPHGEIDGFNSETRPSVLVHTPPHMEAELTRHVKAGDVVSVRGVRPRKADLVAAVAVITTNGARIIDQGPGHDREHPKLEKRKMSAEGAVRLSLFGPKGELRGALLADGTVIRVGPNEAEPVAKFLAPNARIAARGDSVETKHGSVLHAKEIGTDSDDLRPIKEAKPKPKHEAKPKHDQAVRA
ncbi:hypothetical protein MTX26_29210 [Bradyrhizobium sp. ISRA443]|uniref:hypothetical protein n=1 Tax=unclassified Bradyrhizobium TaxID=2631580 RepID=UPI00247AF09E|nr:MULTISPECIES: hypothetical protein [unclassified Bradyrhizobium]WGR93715.1 hypothetical protein MTX20_04130 [Bradyrhizobium sp. ISRA435]WGR98295.1 hypothetical protein MTX23_29200 [Bradyrhizobium sp. ISRA436]WGS05183.1 hypothetical protein MTX18_29215 [Bradyrhizobium sp. ISRA437]WGS12069.1 hypothetical protein MTX26_29210 [Bradyrhizobium sp. ISRA443]